MTCDYLKLTGFIPSHKTLIFQPFSRSPTQSVTGRRFYVLRGPYVGSANSSPRGLLCCYIHHLVCMLSTIPRWDQEPACFSLSPVTRGLSLTQTTDYQVELVSRLGAVSSSSWLRAFPDVMAGPLPQLSLRGLLIVYAHYGLHTRGPSFERTLHLVLRTFCCLHALRDCYRPRTVVKAAGWVFQPTR